MRVSQEKLNQFGELVDKAIGYDTPYSFFDKCNIDPKYMKSFFSGIIDNVPHDNLLRSMAYFSNGKVKFEEFKTIFNGIEPFEIKKGQIWQVDFGEGIGSEQKGIRPAMIIQNNIGNRYSPTVIVNAITSKTDKKYIPTHVPIGQDNGLDKPSLLMAEQIKTIDKQRLHKYIGTIEDVNILQNINKAYKISGGVLTIFDEIEEAVNTNTNDEELNMSFSQVMTVVKNFLGFYKNKKKEQTFTIKKAC